MSQEAKKPRITWLLDALRSSKHRLHHYTPKLQKHSTELIERLGKKLPDFKSSMQKTDCELTNKGGSKASQTFSKVTSKIKSTVGSGINASKPFINSTVEKATKVFGSTTNAFKQAFKAATRASADKFKKNINKGGELGQNLAKLAVSSAQHLNTKYSIAANVGATWKSISRKALWIGFGAIAVYSFASATPGAIARYVGMRRQRVEYGEVLRSQQLQQQEKGQSIAETPVNSSHSTSSPK